MTAEKLSEKERKEIEERSRESICLCGHKKKEHNRFVNCLFVGCFQCSCGSFEWPEDKKEGE